MGSAFWICACFLQFSPDLVLNVLLCSQLSTCLSDACISFVRFVIYIFVFLVLLRLSMFALCVFLFLMWLITTTDNDVLCVSIKISSVDLSSSAEMWMNLIVFFLLNFVLNFALIYCYEFDVNVFVIISIRCSFIYTLFFRMWKCEFCRDFREQMSNESKTLLLIWLFSLLFFVLNLNSF